MRRISSRVPLGLRLRLVVGVRGVAVEPAGLVEQGLFLLLLGGEPGEEAAREHEAHELEGGHRDGSDAGGHHAVLDGGGHGGVAGHGVLGILSEAGLGVLVVNWGDSAVSGIIPAAAGEGDLDPLDGGPVVLVELGPAIIRDGGDVVPHDIGGNANGDLEQDEEEDADHVGEEEVAALLGGTKAAKEGHDKDEAAKGNDPSRDGHGRDAINSLGQGVGSKSNQDSTSDLVREKKEKEKEKEDTY